MQQRHDRLAGARVELAGRLVGDQHLRPRGDRASDGDALLLPARQLVGTVLRSSGEADLVQHLVDPSATIGRRPREQPQRHLDVLGGREHGQQPEALEDVRDGRAAQFGEFGVVHRRQVATVDDDRPGIGPIEPSHHVEQRRLAAARTAVDHHERTGRDRERDLAERTDRLVRRRERPCDIGEDDHVRAAHVSSPFGRQPASGSASGAWSEASGPRVSSTPARHRCGRVRVRGVLGARARGRRRSARGAASGRRRRAPRTPG